MLALRPRNYAASHSAFYSPTAVLGLCGHVTAGFFFFLFFLTQLTRGVTVIFLYHDINTTFVYVCLACKRISKPLWNRWQDQSGSHPLQQMGWKCHVGHYFEAKCQYVRVCVWMFLFTCVKRSERTRGGKPVRNTWQAESEG